MFHIDAAVFDRILSEYTSSRDKAWIFVLSQQPLSCATLFICHLISARLELELGADC